MSFISWIAGEILAKNFVCVGGKASSCRIIIWLAVLIDIATLGFFKYYNFFVDSFSGLFGLDSSIHSLKIVLPLGISFFTFQAIAYVVDAYNGKLPLYRALLLNERPEGLIERCSNKTAASSLSSLVDCLLYIGFFPKLLAGPIERPTHLLPQIQQKRVFNYDLSVDGGRQILWGLFKKVVVADNCAVYVNAVYADYTNQSGSTLLLAAILYTIQIYGDFSGYSDMAIGSAKLLGFKFRDNFLFPYFSRNMGEFWKRWHISLNTWFVDYVYLPLGGDGRLLVGKNYKLWIKIRNTMIIFLLSGLWHGADWSFVAWGGYHGLLLVILILLNRNTKYEHVVAYDRWLPNLRELGQMVHVFVLATIGWMMFRADNVTMFVEYSKTMLSSSIFTSPWLMTRSFYLPLLVSISILLIKDWLMRGVQHTHPFLKNNVFQFVFDLVITISALYYIFINGEAQTYIYAQF